MAAEARNASMADGIEIPTANLEFSTTASSKKLFPGYYNKIDNGNWQYGRQIW